MTIFEQILAGLQQKFSGVDTATLTRIATKKAEGVTDESKVTSIVEGISFQDVMQTMVISVQDKRRLPQLPTTRRSMD